MYHLKLFNSYLVSNGCSLFCAPFCCLLNTSSNREHAYKLDSNGDTFQSDHSTTENSHFKLSRLSRINYKECWDNFHLTNTRQHNWRREWIVQPISEYIKNRTHKSIFSNTEIDCLHTSLDDIYARKQISPHAENSIFRCLDVGCGIGNATYPITSYITDNNINAFVYACDFSHIALNLLKSETLFDASLIYPFYCDLSSLRCEFPFPLASLDIVLLLFVLQSIPPNLMGRLLHRLSLLLKPGGRLIIRNSGKNDMFERKYETSGWKLVGVPGCYIRDNGIQEYFFTESEMRTLLALNAPRLVENYITTDRKLFPVSCDRKRVHDRVWIQAEYECI